jgi:sortase A
VRRRLGIGFLVLGALLLGYVGTTWASGAIARDRARAAWEAEQARSAVESVRASLASVGAPSGPMAAGAPVARLIIPSLGLDEIVVEGVGDGELNAGPGHLPGSPLPGSSGNSIISAHRDRHFRSLNDLGVGDVIETETRQHRVTWVVKDIQVLAAHAPALFSTPEPVLTLTTCWPVRFFGPAPDRLLITAVPIDL